MVKVLRVKEKTEQKRNVLKQCPKFTELKTRKLNLETEQTRRKGQQWGPGLDLTVEAPWLGPASGLASVRPWTPKQPPGVILQLFPRQEKLGGSYIRRFGFSVGPEPHLLPTRTHTMKHSQHETKQSPPSLHYVV